MAETDAAAALAYLGAAQGGQIATSGAGGFITQIGARVGATAAAADATIDLALRYFRAVVRLVGAIGGDELCRKWRVGGLIS